MQIPSQKLRIPVEELEHWDGAQEKKKKKRHVEEGRKDRLTLPHYPSLKPSHPSTEKDTIPVEGD